MARKKTNTNTKTKTFEQIDQEIEHLNVQKSLLIDSNLRSTDPESIIKASNYLKENEKHKSKQQQKAYIFSPQEDFFTGLGYKSTTKSFGFDVLRRMGAIPNINAVITTRIEQIQNFSKFTLDDQKEGWTIRKKLSRFEKHEGKYTNSDQDKRVIEQIADFLENGGLNQKWELEDDFEDYLAKGTKDSLELDQMCVEFERNNFKKLVRYSTTDAATMRKLETIDPRKEKDYDYDEVNGFKPIYAQVYNNNICTHWKTKEPIVYYPWELSFVVRNKTSNIFNNGYGKSELEVLAEIVTWLLWGMQYNGNFFKQGSNPRGFFSIEGSASQDMLNEFRSAWRNTIAGIQNSHKVPVFEGSKVSWNDMQQSNKDMEFQNWNEFLMLMTCSVYRIDPSELGLNFKNTQSMFGQDGQKERLEHSKSKGLKPLLQMHRKHINKFIVSELNPNYEFVFTGIDLDDEEQRIKNMDAALKAGITSFEKQFEAFEGEPYNEKKHTILNPVFQQAQQTKMMGGEDMNNLVDQEAAENPFDQYSNGNPVMNKSLEYIDKMLNS